MVKTAPLRLSPSCHILLKELGSEIRPVLLVEQEVKPFVEFPRGPFFVRFSVLLRYCRLRLCQYCEHRNYCNGSGTGFLHRGVQYTGLVTLSCLCCQLVAIWWVELLVLLLGNEAGLEAKSRELENRLVIIGVKCSTSVGYGECAIYAISL